jgi:hypothetical protein
VILGGYDTNLVSDAAKISWYSSHTDQWAISIVSLLFNNAPVFRADKTITAKISIVEDGFVVNKETMQGIEAYFKAADEGINCILSDTEISYCYSDSKCDSLKLSPFVLELADG